MQRDSLKQKKIEAQTAEIVETKKDSVTQLPILSPRMASFLRAAGSATIFTLSFAHLLSRIEAGTIGCDCKLMAELLGSCFAAPTASNWGDMLEEQV